MTYSWHWDLDTLRDNHGNPVLEYRLADDGCGVVDDWLEASKPVKRLIAAAPELLATLQHAHLVLSEYVRQHDQRLAFLVEQLAEAIAQAETP